jgi:hypothetical protein
MPANTKQPAAQQGGLYPTLERHLETSDRDATAHLFEETKAKLGEIAGGAKGPAAKKALAGIERAEGLLMSLHDVREKLEKDSKTAKKARR